MFKLVPKPTFTAAVRLSVPGTAEPVVVQVTFKHKTQREFGAWIASMATRDDVAGFVAEIVESIAGLGDAEGRPVQYTLDVLETLLDQFPSSGPELVAAYRRQLAEARAKN